MYFYLLISHFRTMMMDFCYDQRGTYCAYTISHIPFFFSWFLDYIIIIFISSRFIIFRFCSLIIISSLCFVYGLIRNSNLIKVYSECAHVNKIDCWTKYHDKRQCNPLICCSRGENISFKILDSLFISYHGHAKKALLTGKSQRASRQGPMVTVFLCCLISS